MRLSRPVLLAALLLTSHQALACACGCGVFSVSTSALLPKAGASAYLEYDYLNQTEDWNGTSSAPAADNDDMDIRSDFYTAGLQYTFDRTWGISVAVPYTDRLFITEDGGTLDAFHHQALGDVRIMGSYSGFSDDLSTGIDFGLKLPTGDYTYSGFDRDTSLGTGTTDLILGAYHQANLDADNLWTGFAQAHYQWALAERAGYRPGNELDLALGVYYSGWEFGSKGTLAPVLQLITSDRRRDTGVNAANTDSGYLRVLAAPGLELDLDKLRLYADVELPLYQDVNGHQLVAPRQYKFIVSYSF
jgi:hypothetical protein